MTRKIRLFFRNIIELILQLRQEGIIQQICELSYKNSFESSINKKELSLSLVVPRQTIHILLKELMKIDVNSFRITSYNSDYTCSEHITFDIYLGDDYQYMKLLIELLIANIHLLPDKFVIYIKRRVNNNITFINLFINRNISKNEIRNCYEYVEPTLEWLLDTYGYVSRIICRDTIEIRLPFSYEDLINDYIEFMNEKSFEAKIKSTSCWDYEKTIEYDIELTRVQKCENSNNSTRCENKTRAEVMKELL